MRITHAILTPRLSGAEVLAAQVAERQTRAGHEVAIVSLAPSESSFRVMAGRLRDGGVHLDLPSEPGGPNRLGRIGQYADHLRSFRPDVIVAHSVIPSAYARIASSLVNNAPTISVLHDASQDDYAILPLALAERLMLPRPAAVVGVAARAVRNYLCRFGRHMMTAVIANGIDIQAFRLTKADREKMRSALGVPNGTVVFAQIGRINPVKRQLESIRAFAQFRHLHDGDARLIFAGAVEYADYQQQLQGTAAALGVKNDVIFLGAAENVPALLAAADGYLMPSSLEAFSVACVEALASGLPLILSNIDAFGFAAIYPGVSYIDPSCTLEFAGKMREVAVSRGRVHERSLERFSIERTAADYSEICRRVVRKPV